MTDDSEALSYRHVMEWSPRTVAASVTMPSGHVVELVTHEDGRAVWLDRRCKRATSPEFATSFSFTDDVVTAWHEGTLDPDQRGYRDQLRAVAAEIDTHEKAADAARKRRQKLIRLAREDKAENLSQREIAALLGLADRNQVYKILKKDEASDETDK